MDSKSRIEIVEYDAAWPAQYDKEKKFFEGLLLGNCAAIHHVGSTSVHGMLAKPILDIIVVANNRGQAIDSLEKTEYLYKGEWNIPLQCGFTKRGTTSVNLHMFFDKNHPEIELNLFFRDYLRTHKAVRTEYANIKKKILLAGDSHKRVGQLSFPIYTIKKRNFIDNIIKKIGFNRLRVLKCLTDEENSYAAQFLSEPMDHPDHEHFILYKGVKIVGYAHIKLCPVSKKASVPVIVISKEEFKTDFWAVIKMWLSVHGYEAT